ncbi:hypothetical protein ACFLTT_00210 [Chloroflexota bacterium]
MLKAIDILPPRIFFNIYFLVLLVIIPAAIIHTILIFADLEPSDKPQKKELSPKGKKTFYVFIVLMVIIVSTSIGLRILKENSFLNNAKEQFEVNVNDEISEKRVDSTLIELEKQFERLRDKYLVTDVNEPITIELFPDADSLRAHTAIPSWGDACIVFESGNITISLPAETPKDDALYKSAQEITPYPAHEIAHLIIYSKLGPDYKAVLPLWFNEGIAQYESHRGFINRHRIGKRLGLWLINIYKPTLLEDGQFILYSTKYPSNDVDIYYVASFEFVRYIESTHNDSIKNILHRLAIGETFTSAFEEEIGEPVGDFYIKWYEYFF